MKNSSSIDINNVEVLEIPENKNNHGSIKIFVLVLIMILILLFGIGLYAFLKFAKENTKEYKLDDKIVELGNNLDKNVNNYINDENCKINLNAVKEDAIGKYKYTIKCKKKNYYGYIIIKDTTKPTVSTKIVNILPNEEFKIEQFILNSYDLTNLVYKYDASFDINNYNKNLGLYLIPIHVLDSSNNQTDVEGILLVSNVTASKYLSAIKYSFTNYNATLKITDKIGINNSNYYVNSLRIYEYTFNGSEEYNKSKEEYKNTNKIDGISGNVSFDDKNNIVTIYKILNKSDLDLLNGSFPFTYTEISILYSKLGYDVKLEYNN